MNSVQRRTRELLVISGLADRELDALEHPPIHTLPTGGGGFGLVGGTGAGKTWALVHQVARGVVEAVTRQPDPSRAKLIWVDGEVARDRRVLWVNWHDQVEDIHRRRFDDVWVDAWSTWAEDVPLLVLDDLGRERFEGAKDPARAVLVRVLDTRHRRKCPVLWTSNLNADELSSTYGAALASRILGSWPAYEVEGQDLRLCPLMPQVELKKVAGGDQ
jgi:DNA replication protein DnaC